MKKLRKKIFISILIVGVLCFLLPLIIYLYLPEILEEYVIPVIAHRAGIVSMDISVDRADINGIDISSLKIADNVRSGLTLDNCIVDLDRGSVKSIELTDLKVSAVLKDGNVLIPGLELPSSNGSSEGSDAKFALPAFLASGFSLIIRNSQLNVLVKNGDKFGVITIPFNLQVKRSGNRIKYVFDVSELSVKYDKATLLIPHFSLSGIIFLKGDSGYLSGTAKFADIDIVHGKLTLKGCSGEIPFSFSITKRGIEFILPKKDNLHGWCTIQEIAANGDKLKDISLNVVQTGKQFIISGTYSKLIIDRPFKFAVYITPPYGDKPLDIDIISDFHEKDLDIDLSSIPHSHSTATFTGDIDFHSEINIRDMKPVAACKVSIHNGNIEDKVNKLSLEGLSFDFTLDDLLKLKSRPSQKLSFKKCTYKNFTIENGDFTFQTESPDSFLLEKSQFGWCDGTVAVNSFRFIPSHPKDIDLILYCDRLNVAELLNQFNVGHASGEGRVSGKIPVVYKQRKLDIDNGFLYSTPGFGGHIALIDFMGPLSNMSGAMQLDIAKEALRDFNYQWIRIKLNSEKDDLLLQLEMKGAPGSKMPFGFDLARGGLYKSDKPDVTAKFLGISFQINFRLPASRVLEYESGFQKLQGKFK